MRTNRWLIGLLAMQIMLVIMAGCKSQSLSSGILYVHQQLYDKGIIQLEQAVALEPNNAEAHAYLGQAYAETGQHEKAGAEFAKAIELATQQDDKKFLRIAADNRDHYWAVKYNEGLGYTDEEDFGAAEKEFKSAIYYKPEDVQTLSNYGFVLSRLGKNLEAIEVYKKALSLEPENETTVSNLAGTYFAEGDSLWSAQQHDDALTYYERALALTPESSPVLARVADSYYLKAAREQDQGKQAESYSKAASYYEKVAAMDTANASVLFNLGLCYMGLKDADKAIQTFRHIVVRNPKDAEAHNFLGSAYFLKGEKQKATVEFSLSGALEKGVMKENVSEWVTPGNLKKKYGDETDTVKFIQKYGVPEEVSSYQESGLEVETWYYWQKRLFVSFVNGKEFGVADYTKE